MLPDPTRPAYTGPGLSTLVPALVAVPTADWLPPPVRDAKSVVLLVIDGLGWNAIEANRERLPAIAALEGGPVPTVVPSTTATALTSLTTGLSPSQHGVMGFRIRVDGGVLNILSWQGENKHPPDPRTVQRHEPFLHREVPVVTSSEFRGSSFSQVHYGNAPFHGWHTTSALVEHCRRLVLAGEPLIYAYYPGVDKIAHAHGLHDGFYEAELAAADRLVGDVRDALPPSCALAITADHGQVHMDPDGWVSLDALGELIDGYAGDARFRYLYARRGAADELLAAARAEHGERAWVFSRDELFDDGWLGPDATQQARARVGDVVLAARADVGFIDPALEFERRLRSAHGSLTPDEMLVPVLAGRGTGPAAG